MQILNGESLSSVFQHVDKSGIKGSSFVVTVSVHKVIFMYLYVFFALFCFLFILFLSFRMTVILDPNSVQSGTKAMEAAARQFGLRTLKGGEKYSALLQFYAETAIAKQKAVW